MNLVKTSPTAILLLVLTLQYFYVQQVVLTKATSVNRSTFAKTVCPFRDGADFGGNCLWILSFQKCSGKKCCLLCLGDGATL